MKIAIVTDSNSGITQKEGKELGISVIPMPFMADGKTYFEDIDLNHEDFFQMLARGADISTSQPAPQDVTRLWDELLKEYEAIVHIPMSSGLSGSCQTAMMLAEDFDGRVFVVDNQRISVTQYQSALDAMELARVGLSGAQIKEILEREARESSIYIMVDTLKYLKKGGRITPAAAALGTLLRIKPVLQIQGGKLDSFSKARTVKQAKTTMLSAIAKDLEERFDDPKAEKCWMEIAYSCEKEIAEEFQQEIRQQFPQVQQIHMDPLSLSVACHIGPGALAVAITKKIDAEAERSHYGK